MAKEKGLQLVSFPANANLSARQFRCVNLSTDGQLAAAGAGATYVLGVLQNKPAAAGRAGSVAVGGVTKVEVSRAAAAVTAGAALVTAANGVAIIASTGGTAYVWGRAMEAVSTSTVGNVIISAQITHEGPTSTA